MKTSEHTLAYSTSDHRTAMVRDLLTDYAGWLLGCGATCIRLEKNIKRIAAAYGQQVEITISPHHVHLYIVDRHERTVFTSIATAKGATSFDTITRLSTLSWRIADTAIDITRARRMFDTIVNDRPRHTWVVPPLVALANASFCRLFGGDIQAMAVVFMATLAGYNLKMWLTSMRADLRLTFLLCSFASAVIGASSYLFNLGDTPQIAIGTSILYLVPGVPFLNSFSDMLHRFYICSFGRLMDATVLTACLSIGLCAGMIVMGVGMF